MNNSPEIKNYEQFLNMGSTIESNEVEYVGYDQEEWEKIDRIVRKYFTHELLINESLKS